MICISVGKVIHNVSRCRNHRKIQITCPIDGIIKNMIGKDFWKSSRWVLRNCQGRKFTTSLGNLFQCLTALTMEEFLPYTSLAAPLLCLAAEKFSSCHFSAHIWSKSGAKFSLTAGKESFFPYPMKSTFLVQDKDEVKKKSIKINQIT